MTASKSKTSPTDAPSPDPSKVTSSRLMTAGVYAINTAIVAAAGFYSYRACGDTGWLFGWLIGASKSSVTNTVVPLILAIITGTVFTLIGKGIGKMSSERIWYSLAAVAALSYLTMIFVGRTIDGLREGVDVRLEAENQIKNPAQDPSPELATNETVSPIKTATPSLNAEQYKLNREQQWALPTFRSDESRSDFHYLQHKRGKRKRMLISELADFFASSPSRSQIVAFKLSDAVRQRAHELLELNRSGRLTDEQQEELNELEFAESLMGLVKARIRASEQTGASE